MNARRNTLGRRIKRARQRAGYARQRAFAEAIGISEASVANAERGSGTVGDKVFGAIEVGLGWPEDCTTDYLEHGDPGVLPSHNQPLAKGDGPDLRDDVERKLWAITDLSEEDRWIFIDVHRARKGRQSEVG